MRNKKLKRGRPNRLQGITLCISTSMVLILLGLLVFFVLTARNLSASVKENLLVTLMLDSEMTKSEAAKLTADLNHLSYVRTYQYVDQEQALAEATKALGTDPMEFTDGVNPFPPFIELSLQAEYANNDSLKSIAKELSKYPHVSKISYHKDLVDKINSNLAKVSVVLLFLAVLLSIVSFSLINNTVKLSVYARRFSIHTMKLVGASWNFIRAPFYKQALGVGITASLLALSVLATLIYLLYLHEPQILTVVTWEVMAITGGFVLLFGLFITFLCTTISVNKFLKMSAEQLYKI